MRRLFRVMAMLAAAAWPAVALAAGDDPAPPDLSGYEDAELASVQQAFPQPLTSACTVQGPAARELVRRHPEDAGLQGNVLYDDILCATGEERFEEARRLLGQYEGTWGKTRFTRYFGLLIAYSANDGPAALAGLRDFAADDSFTAFPPAGLGPTFKVIIDAGLGDELGRFALDYSAGASFAKLDPELQQSFAFYAFDAAVKQGDRARAVPLLGPMRHPTPYAGLLADRKYEAFWPEIEERVGDHFGKITAFYLGWAKTRYRQNKDDRARLAAQAWALYYDDRFEEAIAFVRKEGRDRDALYQMAADDAWGLQVEALSLDRLGRKDEASAVYDKLVSAPPEQYWLVNFVINRALRLLDGGNWEAGLAATNEAGKVADASGTFYARMNVAYGRTCALYRLGRPGEAEADLAFLREHADESAPLAAMGLLCAKQEQQAVDLLVAKLADEKTRTSILLQLQPPGLRGTESVLPQLDGLLEHYPQLKQAFDRYGRVIPARFAPRKSGLTS